MEREGEVTAGFVGARMRTIPSRRAFRYFAWPSRSIPLLVVAVGCAKPVVVNLRFPGSPHPVDRTDQREATAGRNSPDTSTDLSIDFFQTPRS